MAVVKRNLTELILYNLINAGFSATYSESRGGMLRQSQNTLYIAVTEKQLQEVLKIIKDICRKHNETLEIPNIVEPEKSQTDEITTGNAVVFVWDLNQMEKY